MTMVECSTEFLGTQKVAEILQIDRASVFRWAENLPGFATKVNGRWRVPAEHVRRIQTGETAQAVAENPAAVMLAIVADAIDISSGKNTDYEESTDISSGARANANLVLDDAITFAPAQENIEVQLPSSDDYELDAEVSDEEKGAILIMAVPERELAIAESRVAKEHAAGERDTAQTDLHHRLLRGYFFSLGLQHHDDELSAHKRRCLAWSISADLLAIIRALGTVPSGGLKGALRDTGVLREYRATTGIDAEI